MKPINIVRKWMNQVSQAVADFDHNAHMNLISKSVKAYGVPGIDIIEYDDWESQCEQDFKHKLVAKVSYSDLSILMRNKKQILFQANEVITTSSGAIYDQSINAIITLEKQQWRIIQLKVLGKQDARRCGLISDV